jgi:hypothetical protein
MFYNSGVKISKTQTSTYSNEYRIPSGNNNAVSVGYQSLSDMFNNITPSINTTYYTNATVI